MEFEKLAALPVASWAARDCRLFMSAIDSHLPQALALGESWRFVYSTVAFVWVKQTRTGRCWQFGGGHVTRKGSESCLLFRRGNVNRRRQVIRAAAPAAWPLGRTAASRSSISVKRWSATKPWSRLAMAVKAAIAARKSCQSSSRRTAARYA
jgi:N6-adenosine-specific RNA methylase IME4